MRMSSLRYKLLVLLGLILVAALALANPASASRIPCRPSAGTFTITHSATARIFTASNANDYACLYSSGRARYLSPGEHYLYEHVRFAGPYVAFVMNISANDDHVGVLNMRTGKLRNYAPVTPITQTGANCSTDVPVCRVVCPTVSALVLKADGALAWIATNFFSSNCMNPPGPVVDVWRHDARGLSVVDTGTSISLTSLRLSGSSLTWKNAGLVQSSTLF